MVLLGTRSRSARLGSVHINRTACGVRIGKAVYQLWRIHSRTHSAKPNPVRVSTSVLPVFDRAVGKQRTVSCQRLDWLPLRVRLKCWISMCSRQRYLQTLSCSTSLSESWSRGENRRPNSPCLSLHSRVPLRAQLHAFRSSLDCCPCAEDRSAPSIWLDQTETPTVLMLQ